MKLSQSLSSSIVTGSRGTREMHYRSAHFGPDTLRTMAAALNEAWADAQKVFAGLTAGLCLPAMAAAVLEAAARGERDPVRLRQAALSGIGGDCPKTRH